MIDFLVILSLLRIIEVGVSNARFFEQEATERTEWGVYFKILSSCHPELSEGSFVFIVQASSLPFKTRVSSSGGRSRELTARDRWLQFGDEELDRVTVLAGRFSIVSQVVLDPYLVKVLFERDAEER